MDDQKGKLNTPGTAIAPSWMPNRLQWTLDALGNQLNLTRRYAQDSRVMTHNAANEIQTLRVRGDAPAAMFGDEFASPASASDWEPLGRARRGRSARATPRSRPRPWPTPAKTRRTPAASRCWVPTSARTSPSCTSPSPANATAGEVGYVFGYKGPGDYWVQAADLGADTLELLSRRERPEADRGDHARRGVGGGGVDPPDAPRLGDGCERVPVAAAGPVAGRLPLGSRGAVQHGARREVRLRPPLERRGAPAAGDAALGGDADVYG